MGEEGIRNKKGIRKAVMRGNGRESQGRRRDGGAGAK